MRTPLPHPDRRPWPAMQPLFGGLTLRRGRVHLVCGTARHAFAALLMGRTEGAVLWFAGAGTVGRPHPGGLQPFADPGRLILAEADDAGALAPCLDAALRSGAPPLVIADLPGPPDPALAPMLAEAAGAVDLAARGLRPAPLCLLLAPMDARIATETRWRMAPVPSPGPDLGLPAGKGPGLLRWRVDRLQARDAPPAAWHLTRGAQGRMTLADCPGGDGSD